MKNLFAALFRCSLVIFSAFYFAFSSPFLSLLSLHTGASWHLFTRAKKTQHSHTDRAHTRAKRSQQLLQMAKSCCPLAGRITEMAGERRTGDSHAVATRITSTVTTTERRESTWNHNPCVWHNTIRRRLEGFAEGIDIGIVIESATILRRRSNGTRKANTATKVATGLTGRLRLVAVWQPWQLLRAFVYSFATKLKAHNLFMYMPWGYTSTHIHAHKHTQVQSMNVHHLHFYWASFGKCLTNDFRKKTTWCHTQYVLE